MAETLGSLVDRLITVNMKLWKIQDLVHQAAASESDLKADIVGKLDSLNRQRNKLMTEIDLMFLSGLKTGKAEVDDRFKFP